MPLACLITNVKIRQPDFACSSLNTKKEGAQNHVDFKRPANSFT